MSPDLPEPVGAAGALRRLARDAGPAVAVYLGVRVVGLLGLVAVSRARGTSPLARLHSWDALWLTRVAENGYDTSIRIAPTGRPELTDIVFFPVMPALMRLVAMVTPLSPYLAGLVVSAVAGCVAAVALDRIGRLSLGTRRAGLVLVALWAAWPHAIVLSMAYTEALFVAFAAWSLLAAMRQRWVGAGLLALLAGATRPIGVVLAVALACVALPAAWRAVRQGRRGEAARAVAAVVLAPLGWLAFIGWVGWALHRPDGWFWMQRVAWLSRWDGGGYELAAIGTALTRAGPTVFLLCALIVLACVVLLLALVLDVADGLRRAGEAQQRYRTWSTWGPLVVYAGLVVVMTVGTAGYQHSKPRFLLVAFPLLLPLARALAGASRRGLVLALSTAALASAWYGGYLLVVWTGSP